MKLCRGCDTVKPLTDYYMHKHLGTPRSQCKSCLNLINSNRAKKSGATWPSRLNKVRVIKPAPKPEEDTHLLYQVHQKLTRIRKRVGDVKSCTLVAMEVYSRLKEINLCCELTGLPMRIAQGGGLNHASWDTWTIDRIDPNKGYTTDNCRHVLFCVNSFKGVTTDDTMYMVAHALLTRRPPCGSV